MQHEALKLVRQFHNLSLTELAERLGVSKSYLSQIEHGHKKPSLDLLEAYASAFKMPLSHLLLFAENVGATDPASRVKLAIVGKALKMLRWIEEVTEEDRGRKCHEGRKKLSA